MAIYPVVDPVPIVRAETDPPLVLAGDATGLVAVVGADLLVPGQPVRFAASLDQDEPVPDQASIVVTDTNRRAPARWGTIRENAGHTEQAGEEPLVDDPGDNRLEVFPEATDDNRTVAIHSGGASVQATRYGNPVTYTADDRAINAFDGDPYTAWRVGDFSDVVGERLVIDLDRPAGTRQLTFLQPQNRIRTRHITELAVHHGDGETQVVPLDDRSLEPPGQTVQLDHPVGDHVELEILGTNVGQLVEYDGQSGVGFAEVVIGDLVLEERIRPPTDVLTAAGTGLADHDLAFLFSRRRSNPAEPVRFEAEQQLIRIVDLPRARTFDGDGTARVSGYADEATVSELLDLDGPLVARSSDSLPGSLTSMAWAAFDDDPATSWQTPFHDATGRWIEAELPEPRPVETLRLELVADGRHSVPTALTVVVDDGAPQTIPLPEIADADEPWSTTPVTVDLPEPVTGSTVRVELAGVRPVLTTDWYGSTRIATPVGITELDVGQDENLVVDRSASFDTGCTDDVMSIDEDAVSVRVTGTIGAALDRAPLDLVACDPIELASGEHVLRTRPGRLDGLDVDQVLLRSPAPRSSGVERLPAPVVEVTDEGRTSYDLDVSGIVGPFWLVLGQSHSPGWTASASGLGDLGEPELIDGYANGWWVDPGELDALTVTAALVAPAGRERRSDPLRRRCARLPRTGGAPTGAEVRNCARRTRRPVRFADVRTDRVRSALPRVVDGGPADLAIGAGDDSDIGSRHRSTRRGRLGRGGLPSDRPSAGVAGAPGGGGRRWAVALARRVGGGSDLRPDRRGGRGGTVGERPSSRLRLAGRIRVPPPVGCRRHGRVRRPGGAGHAACRWFSAAPGRWRRGPGWSRRSRR